MKFEYPPQLPVSAAKEAIVEAISSSQVVIISGQTGSGKTTQLPKILLELGRGSNGKQIVHTQPRRIAARTVAERIASELGTRLGDEVGYQVRFTDESSAHTRLRVVTDGILLAQIGRDPLLKQYDTVIIDEAHERSLNIDFLLGYLTTLLPQRPDLQLIITSATIDSVKFQEHFEHALGTSVPVIEVSGRTFPVTIAYEPLGYAPALMNHVPGFSADAHHGDGDIEDLDEQDMDMPTAVARACMELAIISTHDNGPRDILVFAAGERDIHDYEAAISRAFGARVSDPRRPDAIEIMPLFARLSAKDQHRVFESHTRQRIVIATNVAETSLTVPGIRYVVDPGLARISRYSKASKVQRLPIEPISQASANQRSGRCGRIADGIAIRLYSSEDFETRPEFTEPEILRTSLGSVVLHMLSVGVAKSVEDVTNFGFIDPPDLKAVTDGFQELTELRAISRKAGRVELTKIGRQLSRLPIDVRLGRMIVEAARNTSPNTLAALLVIVAFLSLQDPRERPQEKREDADRIHHRYDDPTSDFLSALNLWDRAYGVDGELSNRALRKLCASEYLHFLRMRQWKDLVTQLRALCKELHFTVGEPIPISRPSEEIRALDINQQAAHSLCCTWDSEGIHRSILAGLLSMIGMQVVHEPKASDFSSLHGAARARAMKRAQKMAKNNYQGARGTHFALFPASSVASSTPSWVMSTELVETSRLWARYCASIDPAWAVQLARNLTRTTYANPHWSASQGSAIAQATVLLYGLPIVSGKHVQWGRINPNEARDFLIRQGLVEGEYQQRFSYDDVFIKNRSVLEQAQDDANRTRQIANTVSEEDLVDFYQSRIPHDVTSIATLAQWWKREYHTDPHALDFDPDKVERLQAYESYSTDDFPDHWHTYTADERPINLRLSYIYDINNPADGVSVHIDLRNLSQITQAPFTWNVPGLRNELIVALIKALPKSIRVQCVPAPNTALRVQEWIDEHYTQEPSNASALEQWPDFIQVFAQAIHAIIGVSIDDDVLQTLSAKLPAYLSMTFIVEQTKRNKRGTRIVQELARAKSLKQLQLQFHKQAQESARKAIHRKADAAKQQGKVVQQVQLLQKAGATNESRSTMLWNAALEQLRLPNERVSSRWLGKEALVLAGAPYDSTKQLVEDIQLAAVKRLLPNIDHIEDDQALQSAIEAVSSQFEDSVYQVARDVVGVLQQYAAVDREVSGKADLSVLNVLQSIREHLAKLVYRGFIGKTPPDQVRQLARYIHADLYRLAKARTDPNRDVRWAWQAQEAQQIVEAAQAEAEREVNAQQHEEKMKLVEQARWMLEDFYVSLWAQELGVPRPVSIQRITKALKNV